MLLQPTQPTNEVLGYKLREKIGAGGYGEVWVAEAPGGLLKAVKLVFGRHDDNRASRELKSLNRIKEVRHPFLLSLERIEIADGRLIVVTELAEKSLKDRFVECVEEGLAGIPREELMTYVSDAAEALDYLSDEYTLQHLDIKPENLLLVGGHVKVADFGLVKDIDGTQSLMSGLTPAYAPPELFDGRPSDRSDQYSLAIVFQEMLTGIRPFDGKTAAQLASQHLQSDPELRELPAADQRAIKRALAKSPDARFANCRAMVQELMRVKRSRPVRPQLGKAHTEKVKTSSGTLVSDNLPSMVAKLVEKKLPPVNDDDVEATFRPTLFVGIGQTATGVLRYLKRRVRERLGEADEIPSLRFLCLDTDTKNLDRASRGGEMASLDYEDVLAIPLRSSAEYRNRKDISLAWLSRRWIYNVPRSQQTECLRPLGRLAFVDHHKKILDKLDALIDGMTQQDAVEKTALKTELPADRESPRVFIVASISGGIGSGMLPDLAYAVRTVLGEQGYEEANVTGLLLFSSGRSSKRRDVTVANTYSCLSELNHFGYLAGYPGDPATDLPECDRGPAFDQTYLVDLGSDPLPDEYEATADELAEYLYLNAATECGAYLDACRQDDSKSQEGKFFVRTVGLSHTGWMGGDAIALPANVLCHELLSRWNQPIESCGQQLDPRSIASHLFDQMRLSRNGIANRVSATLAERLGRSLEEILVEELKPLSNAAYATAQSSNEGPLFKQVEFAVDRILGIDSISSETRFEARLGNVMDVTTDAMTDQLRSGLSSYILSCLDEQGLRLWGTEQIRQDCCERLGQISTQLREIRTSLADETNGLKDALSAPIPEESDDQANVADVQARLSKQVLDYGIVRSKDFLLTYAQRCIAQLLQYTDQLTQVIGDVKHTVVGLSGDFEQRFSEAERIASMGCVGQRDVVSSVILKQVTGRIEELAANLDGMIQAEFFAPSGGFHRVVQEQIHNWRKELANKAYVLARQLVCQEVERTDLDALLAERSQGDLRVAEWIRESTTLSVPHLLNTCGGGSRLMIAVPNGTEGKFISDTLAEQTEHQARAFSVTNGDVAFCYEVGGIPANHVAAMLVHSYPTASELISRIHTRTDIKWQPIINL